MNKPITEKDFAETLAGIGAKFPNNYGHATFELAKRMAIDFAKYCGDNYSSDTPNNEWRGWDEDYNDTVTTEQLFELYQQQKQ